MLPIAFSLFHITNMMDASFMPMTGAMPIWNDDWAGPGEDDDQRPRQAPHGRRDGRTNASATTRPSRSTCARCSTAPRPGSPTLDPAELTRVVITRPFPPQIASTYSARVAGPDGITLLDATECWIYQHGLRHMGEIELARGLVGPAGHDVVDPPRTGFVSRKPSDLTVSRDRERSVGVGWRETVRPR